MSPGAARVLLSPGHAATMVGVAQLVKHQVVVWVSGFQGSPRSTPSVQGCRSLFRARSPAAAGDSGSVHGSRTGTDLSFLTRDREG
jgi:hypothetical protein